MIKLTPKISKQIKDSGIPIIDITLKELKNVTVSKVPPKKNKVRLDNPK